VAVSIIETQATILKAENVRGRVSIEADIPALGQYPTRFIRWSGTGNAPAIGAEVLATMEPTVRQKRFVTDGTFTDEAINWEEMPWQVNWRMTGARAVEGGVGAGVENTTGAGQTSRSVAPGGRGGAGWIDAALRHRVDAMAINDRESVRLAIQHGAADAGNIYGDMAAVLDEATRIAEWLNTRFEARLAGDSPLVAHAESLGAVVTDAPEAPEIKNEADLRAWVEERGWSREAVVEVIGKAGYDSASDYLAAGGNTASGLASVLAERLA